MSGIIIVVGEMGSGKTTEVKKRFVKPTKSQVKVYAPKPKDFAECGNIKVYKDFLYLLKSSYEDVDTLFIVDEAFTVIPKEEPDIRKEKEKMMADWLVNSRKCNNFIFWVFHTFKQVPTWALGYSEIVMRFNTKEQLQHQKLRFQSFPKLVASFDQYPTIPKFEYDTIVL